MSPTRTWWSTAASSRKKRPVRCEQNRYSELKEGDVVSGQVRSLAAYGAFVDLGGIDGLLHVCDISWSRVNTPEDVLSVGQQLQLKVLKVDPESKRISLGLKTAWAGAVGFRYRTVSRPASGLPGPSHV